MRIWQQENERHPARTHILGAWYFVAGFFSALFTIIAFPFRIVSSILYIALKISFDLCVDIGEIFSTLFRYIFQTTFTIVSAPFQILSRGIHLLLLKKRNKEISNFTTEKIQPYFYTAPKKKGIFDIFKKDISVLGVLDKPLASPRSWFTKRNSSPYQKGNIFHFHTHEFPKFRAGHHFTWNERRSLISHTIISFVSAIRDITSSLGSSISEDARSVFFALKNVLFFRVDIPWPTLPKLSLPKFPKITVPQFKLPTISLPKIVLPKLTFPQFKFPIFTLPKFALPKLPSLSSRAKQPVIPSEVEGSMSISVKNDNVQKVSSVIPDASYWKRVFEHKEKISSSENVHQKKESVFLQSLNAISSHLKRISDLYFQKLSGSLGQQRGQPSRFFFFKKEQTTQILLLLLVVGTVGVFFVTFASTTNRTKPITYQGRLLDTNYVPVADGNYSMKFRIYDAATNGNCKWATGTDGTMATNCTTPGALTVSVARGLFSIDLGDNTTGNQWFPYDFSDANIYLETIVGSETLSPRRRLTAVPYALNSEELGGIAASGFAQLSPGSNAQTLTFSGTSENAFTIAAASLTSGSALIFTGPTSNGATGNALSFTSYLKGNDSTLMYLAPTFNLAVNSQASYGLRLAGTSATTINDLNYGAYISASATGASGTKSIYGVYGSGSTASVNGSTAMGGYFTGTATGSIADGSAHSVYGIYGTANGATLTTSGTVNSYGGYFQATGSVDTTGTLNSYGVYIGNPSQNGVGTTTKYGLYITDQTGSDTNYAAIFAGGNVGMGTTTPTYKLQVEGTTGVLKVGGNTATANAPLAYLTDAATNYSDFEIYSDATNVMIGPWLDRGLQFVGNAGTETKMTITNGGDVGIGTTTPSTKLHVTGQGLFQPGIADGDSLVNIVQTNSNAYVHAGIKIQAGNASPWYVYESGSSGVLRFNYNSLSDAGGNIVIDTSGNLGIGTASPGSILDISGNYWSVSVNGTASNGWLWSGTGYGLQWNGSNWVTKNTASANGGEMTAGDVYGNLRFFTVATTGSTVQTISDATLSTYERMRIDGSGNLGIGTTGPTTLFQVAQPTTGVGTVSTTASGTTIDGTGTQFTNTFKVGDTFTVNGETVRTISAIASNTNMTVSVAWANTTTTATYTLTGGTRFSILGNGNVGIGTTAPGEKLSIVGDSVIEVNGTTKTSGWYKFGAATSASNVAGIGLLNGVGLYFDVYKASGGGSLGTDSMDAMVIKQTTGNVGIGTTAPQHLLQVNGPAKFGGNANQTFGDIALGDDASTSLNVGMYRATALTNNARGGGNTLALAGYGGTIFTTGAAAFGSQTTAMVIDTSQNVGIGTSSPAYRLSVAGSTASTLVDGNAGIEILNTNTTNNSGSLLGFSTLDGGAVRRDSGYIWTQVSDHTSNAIVSNMQFYTANGGSPTEKMRITSAGWVGIGTTTPTTMLTVGTATTNTGDITVYGTGTTCTIGNSTGATNCSSDIRLKKNVTNLESELENIMTLRPVTFNWKDPNRDKTINLGLIAQEVKALYPSMVHTVYDDYLGIDYAALVVPTIKGIQELNTKVTDTFSGISVAKRFSTPIITINKDGNVGIGTPAPHSTLQIGTPGDDTYQYLQLDGKTGAPPDTDCNTPSEAGRMIADTQNNLLYVCNGSTWKKATLN